MKYCDSWLWRGFVAALLLGGNAYGDTLFFDNFGTLSPGTVLSPTNYVPNVGASVTITNSNDQYNPTTVVATNFSDST